MALLAASLLSLALVGCLAIGVIYSYFAQDLPQPSSHVSIDLHEPLRVYTADHQLIGEFGKQKRAPIQYKDIPTQVRDAFLAAEDDRFFEHPGIDYQGILRAAIHLVVTGRKSQGGSTITMQLARDLYLSNDRTFTRKLKEMILALRLNETLPKQKVFQLYANKIYLGEGAYGIAAAAQTYYHKPLSQLTTAETAMIAGLPKAPSTLNPIANPSRAKARRNYVLGRMHALGIIDDPTFEQAQNEPITAKEDKPQDSDELDAPYIAETVRQKMVDRYGEKRAYTAGFNVTTTITSTQQKAAQSALRHNLESYAERHDWHGSSRQMSQSAAQHASERQDKLSKLDGVAGTVPAVVVKTRHDTLIVVAKDVGQIKLDPSHNPWLASGQAANRMVSVGDIVRVRDTDHATPDGQTNWRLTELPNVEGALVSLNPNNGAIQAMVGGYAFSRSKFNRATQARRQPGSAFKPFLYSAALANGFTPATLVNDAPVVYHNEEINDSWRPQNYSGRYFGPTRLRTGLVHSRNLVSIRALRRIGIDTAVNYASRFGLPKKRLPHDLSFGLGSASFSPLQMARGYAVFANNGFLIEPHLIKTIRRDHEDTVYRAEPKWACGDASVCRYRRQASASDASGGNQAPRVIKADNAYLIGDMMRDVIRHGTGQAAQKLNRHDLAGKTGTTNNQIDAWFGGFNSDLVTVAWVGFDQLQPLGKRETGAHAALPMWMDYMGRVLDDQPIALPAKPSNLVTVKINPETGKRALNKDGIKELFRRQNIPTKAEARRSGKHSPSHEVQSLF